VESEVQGPIGPDTPREVDQQCLVRDANEAVVWSLSRGANGVESMALRCECGDLSCRVSLAVTPAEYTAVRDYGSRFLVRVNHENPENSSVLSEHAHFSVIDVVGGDARYEVLARNPRHKWVEARDRRT
jgi:hypothetical protein